MMTLAKDTVMQVLDSLGISYALQKCSMHCSLRKHTYLAVDIPSA